MIMMGSINCCYETPCGWCSKWDKKCDKKIGCTDNTPEQAKIANVKIDNDTTELVAYKDIMSGRVL